MIVDLIILGMILIRLTLEDEKLHVHVTFQNFYSFVGKFLDKFC